MEMESAVFRMYFMSHTVTLKAYKSNIFFPTPTWDKYKQEQILI